MISLCSEKSSNKEAIGFAGKLDSSGLLAHDQSCLADSPRETCSGEDGGQLIDDDAISLCSWTTDHGDWEASASCRNPSSGVSEPGSEDGEFRASVDTHCVHSQTAVWNPQGNDMDAANYQVSYVPVFFPMSSMWPMGNPAGPRQAQVCQVPMRGGDCQLVPPAEKAHCEVPTVQNPKTSRQNGSQRSRVRTPKGTDSAAQTVHCSPVVSACASDADASACDECDDAQTTLILRNLPKDWDRTALLSLLNAEGFSGSYNFVHLPIDFQTKSCLGYALVNAVNHALAKRALQHFNGLQARATDGILIEADWNNPQQGFSVHVERYRNSPLMHDSVPEIYRPLLFKHGQQVQFPEPTSRIRPPRIRHQRPSAYAAKHA